ncbi:hypothetical protein FRC08_017503 [Ceratobasidium sp. 394]|nr:hypothetical protein FRC08_017503 [Ceratobasidium sp. 394]
MQFQSSLARLVAFAFFLLSFSMLVCAAPAPVAAPGAGELAVRDGSLVARGDYTSQCEKDLLDFELKLKVQCAALVTCSKTPGCDCASILNVIVGLFVAIVAKLKVQIGLGATINPDVCLEICTRIMLYLFFQLKLCVNLAAELCTALDAQIKIFLECFISLCPVLLKAAVLFKIKATVSTCLDICIKLKLNVLLGFCGLL